MTINQPALFVPRDADYSTESGARRLAGFIKCYWETRGYAPNVYVAPLRMAASVTEQALPSFIVLSDMVNGRPR